MMNRLATVPHGDDYIKRHGLDGLFNDLMNRLLQDRPDDPIQYMLNTLSELRAKNKGLPIVKEVFSLQDVPKDREGRSTSQQAVSMATNYSFSNDAGTKRMRTDPESSNTAVTGKSSDIVTYYTRLAQAWSIQIDWSQLRVPQLMNFIQTYSNAVGCPDEFLLVPLLSITATLMGKNSKCTITPSWREPCVLWTAIAARKGEETYTAGKMLLNELRATQRKEQVNEQNHVNPLGASNSVKLFTNLSTLEDMQRLLTTNGNRLLCFADEMSLLVEMLSSKHVLERKKFTGLYAGDTSCLSDNLSSDDDKACFNITGFMEPRTVIQAMCADNVDDLFANLLVACPPEKDILLEDLSPVSKDTPAFQEVFSLIQHVHAKGPVTYDFNEDSLSIARAYLNALAIRKREVAFDENRRLIIAKARSHFVRLCMVVQCLNDAVVGAYNMKESLQYSVLHECDDLHWHSSSINPDVATAAAYLTECFYLQKCALMPEEIKLNINIHQVADNLPRPKVPTLSQEITDNDEHVSLSYCRNRANYSALDPEELEEYYESQYPKFPDNCENNIRSFLTYEEEYVHSSKVMQVHLMPPFDTPGPGKNRYAAPAAKFFMRKLVNLGFGKLFRKGNKGGLIFQKKKWEDLDESAKILIERCGISEWEYRSGKRSRMASMNGDAPNVPRDSPDPDCLIAAPLREAYPVAWEADVNYKPS